MKNKRFLGVLLCLLFAAPALASDSYSAANLNVGFGVSLPPCLDEDRSHLDQNNEEVLDWKTSTPNQYKDRAHVTGKLVGILFTRKSHIHLEVDLMPQNGTYERREHIEVIFNRDYGDIEAAAPGQPVVACGEYITAREQVGPYRPSPVDAVLHWVHMSNNPAKKPGGFLAIGGKVYGMKRLDLEERPFFGWRAPALAPVSSW